MKWCSDCRCRACFACQEHRLGYAASAATPASAHLVLLLHGTAYRKGGHHTKESGDDNETIHLQEEALNSLWVHVLTPAERAGWGVEVIADVDTPAHMVSMLKAELHHRLHEHLTAVRVQPLLANALTTHAANLEYARHMAQTPPADWRALVLVRIDLLWKRAVELPPPSAVTHEIIVPWRVDLKNLSRVDAEPWINDVLFFIPACRLREVWSFFVRRAGEVRGPWTPLHWICLNRGFACGLRYLTPCATTASTATERNSLYRIVGRPEAAYAPDCRRRRHALQSPLRPEHDERVTRECSASAAPQAEGRPPEHAAATRPASLASVARPPSPEASAPGALPPVRFCAARDATRHLAVLGVLGTDDPSFRNMARATWLAELTQGSGIHVRFVLRGGNASVAVREESARHGDVVFVNAPAALSRVSGPLHSIVLWWECALHAWPRAALIGKADTDTWLHLHAVGGLLEQAMHAMEHALGLTSPQLYWGVMETFSWDLGRREPTRWNYAFRAKGASPPCAGGLSRPTSADERDPALPTARLRASWPSTPSHGSNTSSTDAPGSDVVGPFQ